MTSASRSMRRADGTSPEWSIRHSIAVLQQLFGMRTPHAFAVRLWDGTMWQEEGALRPRFTLVLKHPGALRRMLWAANELTVSKAYLYDDVDVEGDIAALVELADAFLARPVHALDRIRYAKALLSLPADGGPRVGRQEARLRGAPHSKTRDREAIAYHYDVSNEFFAQWLDPSMVYSCAYFESPRDTLEDAQRNKLDYICRKLRLKPGDHLLDIGCGWGALVVHAGLHYGVRAMGITLSRAQAELANARIERAGVAQCRAEYLDYRDLDAAGRFDKIASVGMFEHVGEKMLPEYFERAFGLLRPGGLFLNHAIAFTKREPARGGATFFNRYVFPDGELLPLSTTLKVAEDSGFEVRDVESLREHYEMTLRHWIARLERHHEVLRELADEATYRVWRLYMALAAHQFATARTTIYQTLLCKPDEGRSGLPLTRSDWYA